MLILAIVLFLDISPKRRAGDTFLKFMLLFGGAQVLLESLRYDQHMTVKAYVKLQQVMAIMLLGAGVITLTLRVWRKKKALAITSLAAIPVCVAVGVGIEFMIDRTAVSHYLLYAVFLAVVGTLVVLGLKLRKAGEKA